MIRVICKTEDTLKIGDMSPFQGKLKKRSKKEISKLSESLLSDGLLMPFAIWKHNDENSLLDGHGRLLALKELSSKDSEINEQSFPVLYIEAENEEDAKKHLLQITSSYGKINRSGVMEFCSNIVDYNAPIVTRYNHLLKRNLVDRTKVSKDEKVLKIAVSKDKIEQVRELFNGTDYIRIIG